MEIYKINLKYDFKQNTGGGRHRRPPLGSDDRRHRESPEGDRLRGRSPGRSDGHGRGGYRRGDLEDPFFSDRFPAILHQNFAKFQQNFSDFSEI